MAKKNKQPFDKRGGVVAIQRRLLASKEFLALSAQAKTLIFLLHRHWRPNEPVGFGIRQAVEEIPCSRKKAMDTFNELKEAGFIVVIDQSKFIDKLNAKTRTWRLTWMPYNNKSPTNDWEKNSKKIRLTGLKTIPVERP